MRRTYFECEFCKKQAFNEFPTDWIHIKVLAFTKGFFTEKHLGRMLPDIYQKYQKHFDLTFCTTTCLARWLVRNLNPEKDEDVNPSSSV